MSLTTISNGQLPDADVVMKNFNSFKIKEIYTGTGFDVSIAGAGGTDSDDHELTAINAADLANADYLIIKVLCSVSAVSDNTASNANATLQFQTKEVGGAYADTMTTKTVWRADSTGSGVNTRISGLQTVEWVHTLTAGEKANGVQVKILAVASATNAGDSCDLSNGQTVISLGA